MYGGVLWWVDECELSGEMSGYLEYGTARCDCAGWIHRSLMIELPKFPN